MKNTIAQRIRTALQTGEPKYFMTNSELSRALGVPEPSVRRATYQLLKSYSIIEAKYNWRNGQVTYGVDGPR